MESVVGMLVGGCCSGTLMLRYGKGTAKPAATLKQGIRNLKSGYWNLESGILNREAGTGNQKPE